jgi:folate-binding Fe-S cluster repair protein YgfZ
MKNELNNACLNISTSITGKLNTTVNFHIEYSNLYKFIEKMRKEKSIKDIESYLIRLKQYLLNSMDKTINVYLNSQEIANKHQVFLLNKCESINKNEPYEKI